MKGLRRKKSKSNGIEKGVNRSKGELKSRENERQEDVGAGHIVLRKGN